MSIKRSLLENKWYYRVGKVLFWAPPLLLIALVALTDWQVYYNFFQYGGNIFEVTSFYLILAAVSYLIIFSIVLQVFFYIVFGGVENDMKPKAIAAKSVAGRVNQPIIPQDSSVAVVNYLKEAKGKEATASAMIGLIILIIVYFVYSSSSSSTSGGGGSKTKTNTSTSTCIPTGCGSNWRCSGTYYASSGAQKSISGCYANKTSVTSLNSWSGICLKCP